MMAVFGELLNAALPLLIGGLMLVYEPGIIRSPETDALLEAAYRG